MKQRKKLRKGNIAKHDKQRAHYKVQWGGQRNHKKDNLVVFVEMASLNKSQDL
jgi:hypothetical protein